MLEDLAIRRLGDLVLVADLLGMREELVAADMVEVEMRVDDDADILRLQAEQLQRAGDGLLLASACGFSKGSTFMTWS